MLEVSDTRANNTAHGEKNTEGSNTHEKSCDVKSVEVGDADTSSDKLQILSNKLTIETGNHTILWMNDGIETGFKSVDDSSHGSVDAVEIVCNNADI